MFLIVNKSRDPTWNLALEEHLFELSRLTGRSFVMFWRNRPSVIVGRFQNTAEEVNETSVRAAGVKVVRRLTGGGAVYHDLGNLNYSLIVAHDNLTEFDFRSLAEPILSVLRRLGVPAELSGRNDLTVRGKKISGTAQRAGGGGLLYHGTLLYDVDLNRLSEMLNVAPDKYLSKGVKSIRSRVANLKQWLPGGFTIEELEAELVKEIKAPEMVLSSEDFEALRTLKASRYDTWEWNWGSSPAFSVRKEKRFQWGQISLHLDVADGFIREARIRGDFFAADLAETEKGLQGLPYGGSEMTAYLTEAAALIYGASAEDLNSL